MSLQIPSFNLSNPLPAVIKPVEKANNAAVDNEVKQTERSSDSNSSKIIILYTKELTQEDILMITRHGKLIFFNSSLINVDLKSIDANYIACPTDDLACLRSLEKHFNDDQDNISFCCYCRFFEKVNFEEQMNAFCSFKDAKDKSDFDFQLLNKKNFKKINAFVSCASFVINFLASLKK
jgi:hypothetical protein